MSIHVAKKNVDVLQIRVQGISELSTLELGTLNRQSKHFWLSTKQSKEKGLQRCMCNAGVLHSWL